MGDQFQVTVIREEKAVVDSFYTHQPIVQNTCMWTGGGFAISMGLRQWALDMNMFISTIHSNSGLHMILTAFHSPAPILVWISVTVKRHHKHGNS